MDRTALGPMAMIMGASVQGAIVRASIEGPAREQPPRNPKPKTVRRMPNHLRKIQSKRRVRTPFSLRC